MKHLVFAELVDGTTEQMKSDPKVFILSDGALFLVTTPEHSSTYPELTFFDVDFESYSTYNFDLVCEYL